MSLTAMDAAYHWHRHAVRTDGTLVTEHLRRVAETVKLHVDDEATIAVAWLHDVLEDTDTGISDIIKLFGQQVARDVYSLTDPPELRGLGGEWRHARMVALAATWTLPACAVRLADIYDNAATMRAAKPHYWPLWKKKKKDIMYTMPRHDALLSLRSQVLDRLSPPEGS